MRRFRMTHKLRIGTFMVRVRRGDEERFLSRLREGFPRLSIQLLSVRNPPNGLRIEMIATQTARAIEGGSLLAARPEIDLLLRFAGTTQISGAIQKAGYLADGVKVLVTMGSGPDFRKLLKLASEDPQTYLRIRSAELARSDLETIEEAALLGITDA
jgi:hypothetical protein